MLAEVLYEKGSKNTIDDLLDHSDCGDQRMTVERASSENGECGCSVAF